MEKGIKTAVEHHFGSHVDCGDWCRVKALEGEERAIQSLKYRNKDSKGGEKFYRNVKEIVDEFAENS
jgi:hypothetical protein